MRFVIQRVNKASVIIDGEITGEIKKGFLVLVGVGEGDTEEIADKMMSKLCRMRIFDDENGKTNLGLNDVEGELLLVSQFTLYADCKKGNRPSFAKAAGAELGENLYDYCVKYAKGKGFNVQTGRFGADMKVELENDGPFTVILDSDKL